MGKRSAEERVTRRQARLEWARLKLRWLLAGLAEELGDLAIQELARLVRDLADDGKLNGSTAQPKPQT